VSRRSEAGRKIPSVHAADDFQRHGVTVTGEGDAVRVSSGRLDLGWSSRAGRVPGTAVHFQDRVWEVVAQERTAAGERITLRPWPEGEAIRHAVRLDDATIAALVAERRAEASRRRQRLALRLLLPLAGLLPAQLQRRWERELGEPARRAVVASVALELGFSALAVLQLVSIIFHDPLLPGRWGWLAVLALMAGVEGMVRLAYVRATQEPIGSLFTVAAYPFLAPEAPKAEPAAVAAVAPRRGRPSIVAETLKLCAFALAPGPLQREWAAAQRLSPLAPTLVSAALETAGGLYTLVHEGPRDVAFALLDLLLVGEGALRLALTALHREPCGSVFGILFRRLYPRWLAAARAVAASARSMPSESR
jgi:hypothetical protein